MRPTEPLVVVVMVVVVGRRVPYHGYTCMPQRLRIALIVRLVIMLYFVCIKGRYTGIVIIAYTITLHVAYCV